MTATTVPLLHLNSLTRLGKSADTSREMGVEKWIPLALTLAQALTLLENLLIECLKVREAATAYHTDGPSSESKNQLLSASPSLCML